jgi:hypothetical protein
MSINWKNPINLNSFDFGEYFVEQERNIVMKVYENDMVIFEEVQYTHEVNAWLVLFI